MATPLANRFNSFAFTDEEEIAGRTFTDLNIMWLMNEQARLAEQKLSLKLIDGDMKRYERELIYLDGQLDNLVFILQAAQNPEQPKVKPEGV